MGFGGGKGRFWDVCLIWVLEDWYVFWEVCSVVEFVEW
jgi:hypothetical protein